LLLSLAGIPPLAGFWGKLMLFWETITGGLAAESQGVTAWFVFLAVAGVVNAAIGAGYYLRVIGALYFPARSTTGTDVSHGVVGAGVAMIVCTFLVVLAGVAPGRMIRTAGSAGPTTWGGAVDPAPVQTVEYGRTLWSE
jgi:NADH-quinone oxidoreductase subunit N